MKVLTHPNGRLIAIDAVCLAIAAILVALAALDTAQLATSLQFVAGAIVHIAPFFAASIALAAYAIATGTDNLIGKAFHNRTAVSIVTASVMGALSPFCSCGVVPIIVASLTVRVPLAPVFAFCMASPLMDPATFALTAGTLGFEFAIAKTIIAIGMGLFAGFSTMALTSVGWLMEPLREGVGNGGCAGSKLRAPRAVFWNIWRDPARLAKGRESLVSNGLLLGRMLVLAFILESLMVRYIPAGSIAHYLGGTGVVTILIAALAGVPAYLNGAAALPLVGEMIQQGMAPGAGMAFLIGGGVTSIPAAMAVGAVMRPAVFAAYLSFSIIGAVLAGLSFQLWLSL